jgi:hypothetical protein
LNPIAIALAISVAANVLLGWAYLGQRDTATVAVVKEEQATGAAVACSQGTDTLTKQADSRKKAAAPKREEAKRQAEDHNRKADEILAAPAAAPDDCKSAQARVDAWWGDRK